MLDMTKLHRMNLMFTQGDKVTEKLEIVQLFCRKVPRSNSNVRDGSSRKEGYCKEVL